MVESYKSPKINLTIYGGELRLDSDSLISVSVYSFRTKTLAECCRIESSVYENNPNWPTTILIDYQFETLQPIEFVIKNQMGASQHKFSTTLGEILTKPEFCFSIDDHSAPKKLKIVAKEKKTVEETVNLHFKAHNVDKMDFFGKSDPYFILSKFYNNTWAQVYKSEIVKKTLDPIWKPFQLTMQKLCENDYKLPLKIEVFDWDLGTKDDYIGGCDFIFHQLTNSNCRFELINPKKQKKKKKYSNSGILELTNLQILRNFSFLDYIPTGIKLSGIFALDFTSSNQDPSLPTSLHSLQTESFYSQILRTAATILEQYDLSKLFAAFGFGAEPFWLRRLDHCFALNQNNSAPFVSGVENLLSTYRTAVSSVRQAGPTLVSQVIAAANSISSNFEYDRTYYVLVIVLDGGINDMYQTVSALVQSSFLPLSVVFVGIGNENFEGMGQVLEFPLMDEAGKRSVRKNCQVTMLRECGNCVETAILQVFRNVTKEFEEFMKFIEYFPVN